MINLKSIPFFKILLPYVLGIVFTLNQGTFDHHHLWFTLSFLVLGICFLFQKYYTPTLYFKKGIFIFSSLVFLFLLAQESCFLYNAKNDKNHYSHYVYREQQQIMGVVNDLPVYTERYTKLNINVTALEQAGKWHYVKGNVIVYLKNKTKHPLAIGNVIFIQSKLSYVNEPKNPQEFNYKEFLENKNVFHVVYTDYCYLAAQSASAFTFSQLGTKLKSNVVNILKSSGLSQQAFSVCAALLVGYDDEIDSNTMQGFAHSGTLHVLSVSGMHTGVLYIALLFLFKLFDKNDKRKKLKCVFVIISLIVFSFVTGLSPSVLRASLMLALVIIGKTFYKQGNSYNTLLLSAFILLLVNPYLVLDVGFLLSYLAVFGIMYLHPILINSYYFENKILQWCWNLTAMSIAATLFTLPISLYFFHQFPTWFIFSNLIIIPISVGLMALSFALICCYKIILLKQLLVFVMNILIKVMMWFVQQTDNSNYGYVDYISFTKTDLVFCFLSISCFLVFVYTRQYKHMVVFGIAVIAWLSTSVLVNYQQHQQKELIVFHVNKKPAFALRIGKTLYGNFSELTSNDFQRFIKPYLLSISNPNVKLFNKDIIASKYASVLHANKSYTNFSEINANYIIVSNNTPIMLLNNTQAVIADCSNSYNFVKKLKEKCTQYNVPFYSVKEKNAIQISLN